MQADPVALQQILHNLVKNALRAMDEVPVDERRLSLHVDHADGLGRLTVRDSGPGITPELLPRLFEPFFTTRRDGMGLGLSLCETLAQQMHGTLRARHASPHGAEFTLALPLARSTRRVLLDPVSPLIQIVDDDEAVRQALALLIGTVGLRVATWAASRRVPGRLRSRGRGRDRARHAHAGIGGTGRARAAGARRAWTSR